jgi:hypothetical protein
MNKKTRYIIEGILLIGAIVFAGLKFGLIPGQKHYQVAVMNPSYVFDVFSDEPLVGGSNNVFVGKVNKQIGSESSPGYHGIEGQFDVTVLFNIKGRLDGNIVVDQMGGLKNGVFQMISGGATTPEEYILQPGTTYLFASRNRGREDRHVISVPGRSWQLISNDSKLSSAELLSVIMKDPNVIKYKEAYINEKIPMGEKYTAVNSFKNLPAAEQEKIKAEVAQMKAEASQPKTPEPVVEPETIPSEEVVSASSTESGTVQESTLDTSTTTAE